MGGEIIEKLEQVRLVLGRTSIFPHQVTRLQCDELGQAYKIMTEVLSDLDYVVTIPHVRSNISVLYTESPSVK